MNTETKAYYFTTVRQDDRTYDARANIYLEDEKIQVRTYEIMNEDGDWEDLDERQELAEELNVNYTWEQL